MSEPEKALQSFLQRWSRRKVAARKDADAASDAQAEETSTAKTNARADALPESAAAAFDPASLPPIESINAATDIGAFLAPGVPEELTRAALRRAWVTDPAIRDFVGLAENQWDFTKPDGVPGFGSLDITPAVRRMVAGILGGKPVENAQKAAGDIPDAAENAANSGKTGLPDPAATSLPPKAIASPMAGTPEGAVQSGDNAAPQDAVAEPNPPLAQRRHGGALPQ